MNTSELRNEQPRGVMYDNSLSIASYKITYLSLDSVVAKNTLLELSHSQIFIRIYLHNPHVLIKL